MSFLCQHVRRRKSKVNVPSFYLAIDRRREKKRKRAASKIDGVLFRNNGKKRQRLSCVFFLFPDTSFFPLFTREELKWRNEFPRKKVSSLDKTRKERKRRTFFSLSQGGKVFFENTFLLNNSVCGEGDRYRFPHEGETQGEEIPFLIILYKVKARLCKHLVQKYHKTT